MNFVTLDTIFTNNVRKPSKSFKDNWKRLYLQKLDFPSKNEASSRNIMKFTQWIERELRGKVAKTIMNCEVFIRRLSFSFKMLIMLNEWKDFRPFFVRVPFKEKNSNFSFSLPDSFFCGKIFYWTRTNINLSKREEKSKKPSYFLHACFWRFYNKFFILCWCFMFFAIHSFIIVYNLRKEKKTSKIILFSFKKYWTFDHGSKCRRFS